jgi:hypothetical protein
MTLRDLTPKQAYNLRRKGDKEHKAYQKLYLVIADKVQWDRAFSQGVKAALALK